MKTQALIIATLILAITTSCNQNQKAKTVQKNADFTDVKWKLTSLLDKPINNSDAFISFATEDNKVFGNAGCNNFIGTYTLKKGMHFELSPLATTKKMCEDMSIEAQFLEVLEKADNYSINGNTLHLQKDQTAPLAVFELME